MSDPIDIEPTPDLLTLVRSAAKARVLALGTRSAHFSASQCLLLDSLLNEFDRKSRAEHKRLRTRAGQLVEPEVTE